MCWAGSSRRCPAGTVYPPACHPDGSAHCSLVRRVAEGEVKEIILALSTTMEGDTTNFFIYRKLSGYDVRISVIARGVSIGDEIEYADEITLGRSIINRTEFNLTSSNS